MPHPTHTMILTVLCVPWILHLPFSAAEYYHRNTSDPRYRQCITRMAPTATKYDCCDQLEAPSSVYYNHLPTLLNEAVGIYELDLLDSLQVHVDQAGYRLENYRQSYERFQTRIQCLPWETLMDGSYSHIEIKTLAKDCMCSFVRNSLTTKVRSFYPCDLEAAPQGQLASVYLTLGGRINLFKRLMISLHGNATLLERYDAVVDECFTQFFQQVDERIDRSGVNTGGSISPPSSQSAYTLVWTLRVEILVIAATIYVLCIRTRQEHHDRRRRPPTPPMDPHTAAIADGNNGDTDDVAHPD